ncbi:MAG: hypothetical protein UZ14_CFX002002358 [Chloroflexi bacterium OLB14]|nr:MAG: hypothetical protein UZ14_CFX002002358 [Chloroflexi bacterium OLB14]
MELSHQLQGLPITLTQRIPNQYYQAWILRRMVEQAERAEEAYSAVEVDKSALHLVDFVDRVFQQCQVAG